MIIPGIMGSSLAAVRGVGDDAPKGTRRREQVVWSSDVLQIYRILVDNHAALQFDGHALKATGIITELRIGAFPFRHLYGRLEGFLHKSRDYLGESGLLHLPYDWRDDLRRTAKSLSIRVSQHFDQDYSKSGAARPLIILTHSMGALVARLALLERDIDVTNVRALVHFAPPLLGSAKAFRAAYGRNALPMLSDLVQMIPLCGGNGSLALDRLSGVLRTFTSLYQLMPPMGESFMRLSDDDSRSPFEPRETIVGVKLREKVEHVHVQLSKFRDFASTHRLFVCTIAGVGSSEDTERRYHVYKETDRYRVINEYLPESEIGDGTVSLRSASADGDSELVRQAVGAQHDRICNDRRAIEILGTILQGEVWRHQAISS